MENIGGRYALSKGQVCRYLGSVGLAILTTARSAALACLSTGQSCQRGRPFTVDGSLCTSFETRLPYVLGAHKGKSEVDCSPWPVIHLRMCTSNTDILPVDTRTNLRFAGYT